MSNCLVLYIAYVYVTVIVCLLIVYSFVVGILIDCTPASHYCGEEI